MNKITLNVGGTIFQTTLSTLEGVPFFDALLSNKWNNSKELFIDRDPEGFRHVLGLLRDPQYPFPTQFTYELTFYGVPMTTDIESIHNTIDHKRVEFYTAINQRICNAISESKDGLVTIRLKTGFEMRKYECEYIEKIFEESGIPSVTSGWCSDVKGTYRHYRLISQSQSSAKKN